MDILGDLNTEGMAVMLVTHDAKVAARADRVLYTVDGRIVADRSQGRHTGSGLEERRAAVSKWLLEQDRVRVDARLTAQSLDLAASGRG